MFPDKIFYEPASLDYELGAQLKSKYPHVPWIPIDSHNNIPQLRENPNSEFRNMKNHLIVGVRKSLKYSPNEKVSDFLVPYTSSGCSASCLYCYLVCNYNKCSYLRLFVNREKMMDKLLKTASEEGKEHVFEIGSNSDLVLENTITGNLEWTIKRFAESPKGYITFPTKFATVSPLLGLEHGGRVIMRMSVNPSKIIKSVELATSPLSARIKALNQMCEAGYKVGILIAPVILMEGWRDMYSSLFDTLADGLSTSVKRQLFIEVIFMTYSYVHRAINAEAFPDAPQLYSSSLMTGRGRGKYCYREDARAPAEAFIRSQLAEKLGGIPVVYIV